jgi:ABC-type protease/lipase transport system fused ATPase/permease subunit
LPENQSAKYQFQILSGKLCEHTAGSPGMRLVKSMLSANYRTVKIVLLTTFVSKGIYMLLPNITKTVITYIESDGKSLYQGAGLVGLILFLKCIQNISDSHMYFNFNMLGFNLSNSVSLCIYDKALKYPTLCSKKFQTAELINYNEVDAQRLSEVGYYLSDVLLMPFQLAVGIYLMYSFIGVSFLVGIGIIFGIALMTYFNSKLNSEANGKLLTAKDRRMKIAT